VTTAMFVVQVVEDDAGIRAVLRTLLESQRYRVVESATAERGIIEARSQKPDLVIVDLGLPDRDGITVIRSIRETSPVPILVLSARSAEPDKVAALDAGADDYVAKPFSAPELMARVRAALRRNSRGADEPSRFRMGGVTVDLARRKAEGVTGDVHLTPQEFRVLECLYRNAGMIVTQQQLIREAWGADRQGDVQGLRSYVKMLRQKLEPEPGQPKYLLTEAGIGYRLNVDDEASSR